VTVVLGDAERIGASVATLAATEPDTALAELTGDSGK
jgi:hypothetical protein